MQHEAQLLLQPFEVVTSLALAVRWEVISGFQLDDDRAFNQKVAAMKTDLLPSEHDRNGKLAVDL